MKNTLFITGYSGFLASSLIHQLIHNHKADIEYINTIVISILKLDDMIRRFSALAENFFGEIGMFEEYLL